MCYTAVHNFTIGIKSLLYPVTTNPTFHLPTFLPFPFPFLIGTGWLLVSLTSCACVLAGGTVAGVSSVCSWKKSTSFSLGD